MRAQGRLVTEMKHSRIVFKMAPASAIALSVLMLVACTSTSTAASPDYCRIESAASLDERLVTANTAFAFDLFAELLESEPGQNVFISPLSVSVALAMTYNGAAGETQRAMSEALRLDGMEPDEVNQAALGLLQSLCDLNPEVALDIANSIWTREGYPFKSDFLEQNLEYYGAKTVSLDFNDPAALDAINGWVDDSTRGKIRKIIKVIYPSDVMFLINALYFKGSWSEVFDKRNTKPRAFHLENGTEIMLPMMSQARVFPVLLTEDFDAVKLPYVKENVGMYVFLPSAESSLDEFLNTLSLENWESWMSRFTRSTIDIVLPRFKLEYEAELKDALTALGMGVAFDSDADFSSMSDLGLAISRVKHKAVVDVDEEGTVAAGVTVVAMAVSGHPRIEVDRPFFVAIRDDATGTILFMGAVYEPEDID